LGYGSLLMGLGLSRTRIIAACFTAALAGCTLVDGDRGWSGAAGDRTEAVAQALRGGRARNVILLIGDGMGDSEITMARNYHLGAAGRLAMDGLPFTGACTTYAVQEEAPHLPDYVGDSAASATAWATGHKTSNGRLSTAPGTGESLVTILELAQAHGLATGIVTTAELTDATPAALVAHANHRSCQGPADLGRCPQLAKSAGGPGSIAEQMVDHDVDVLLGGGRQRFEQRLEGDANPGSSVLDSARARGYALVVGIEEQKVLGLFAAGNLSPEWSGEAARPFPGSGPQRCLEYRRPAGEPALAEMTRAALERIEGAGRGFFLQVEGALIDKFAHGARPCEQIGETVAFDDAVRAALDYARVHPDTLVVVTADHAHSGQIVPPPSEFVQNPGLISTLITADGAPMTISYATNVIASYQQHTGTQVRIAAQGPLAANVLGVTDQTDLFFTLARALDLPTHSPQHRPAAGHPPSPVR
jgi:alkaline phosphatase